LKLGVAAAAPFLFVKRPAEEKFQPIQPLSEQQWEKLHEGDSVGQPGTLNSEQRSTRAAISFQHGNAGLCD